MTDLSVDNFLDAVGVAFRNAGHIVPWPLHIARIAPFYADVEAADLIRRMRDFRADGMGPGEMAALYPSSSSAKSLMLDLVPGMKDAGVPAADRLDFVDTVFAGLSELEHGDVFCRDGAHRVLSPAAAAELAAAPGWTAVGQRAGQDLARAAFALSGAAQSLVWSLHFYGWTDISFIIHGPYQVTGPDGRPARLVVRDFFDIIPGDLWPEIPASLRHTIMLCTLHDDTDNFSIDVFNHLLHRRSLLSSTICMSLIIDGSPAAEITEITSLYRSIGDAVRRQKAAIDALDARGVATKFVESRYYAFRHWRQAAGDDWRPPAEVYQRLQDLPLAPDPPGEAPWPVLRDIFDPRLDWPAPAPAPAPLGNGVGAS